MRCPKKLFAALAPWWHWCWWQAWRWRTHHQRADHIGGHTSEATPDEAALQRTRPGVYSATLSWAPPSLNTDGKRVGQHRWVPRPLRPESSESCFVG